MSEVYVLQFSDILHYLCDENVLLYYYVNQTKWAYIVLYYMFLNVYTTTPSATSRRFHLVSN